MNIQMHRHSTHCTAHRIDANILYIYIYILPKKLTLTAMCSCNHTAKNLTEESAELHMKTYLRIFIPLAVLTMQLTLLFKIAFEVNKCWSAKKWGLEGIKIGTLMGFGVARRWKSLSRKCQKAGVSISDILNHVAC